MKKAFILFILSLQFILAQTEPVSIHHKDWQAHQHLGNQPSFFDPSGLNILPLALSKKADLSHTVFGYLPDWEYSNARSNLRYDLLTHIATFDFYVNASGNISNPSYWPWTDVINAAHAQGVKVILTAVNFDSDVIHTLLTNSTAKNNFFKQARDKMNTYKLDGINIDFEGLKSADRGSLLNGFMDDLTDYLHSEIPGSEVSFAGPAVNWGGWDLSGLAASCDYIFIMGYAFYGSWSSTSGPSAPLTGGSYNISNTVNTQYAAVTTNNPQKLILGVPYYGTRWKTSSGNAYASTLDYLGHPRFADAQVEVQQYGREWDSKSQTPWYNYQSGSDWYQVWYDDAASLGLKYDLAESKNYRGVGMWALGYDRSRDELWQELQSRYYFDPPPLYRPTGLTALSEAGNTDIRISVDLPESAEGFTAFWGTDGITFSDSLYITGKSGMISSLETDQLYFIKVRVGNSAFSAITAAQTGDAALVLIVDDFNLYTEGHNQFNYIPRHAWTFAQYGYALTGTQSSAVRSGRIDLNDFEVVDWYVGDQRDSTLTDDERSIIQNYLENGGKLFISGSNLGYDLVEKGDVSSQLFYQEYLKADYRADAPFSNENFYHKVKANDSSSFSGILPFYFDDGNAGTYAVSHPDAIQATGGSALIFSFDGISKKYGGCGVSYRGRFGNSMLDGTIVYLSFPFETITDSIARQVVMDSALAYFNLEQDEPLPEKMSLIQNYPNPFVLETTIPYEVGAKYTSPVQVKLVVYNVLGQQVRMLENQKREPGTYPVIFNAQGLANGIYFYRLETDTGFSKTRKMILLR